MGDEKTANAATSYGVDSNWYADSGATDHVTGELDKLAVRDAYHGTDQIYTASGSGMRIKHIGQSIIRSPLRDLHLNHVLHVPQASKNLASVHRITSDNNVFFELHPDFFFIKDRESRKTLLQGKSRGGLYPLPCSLTAASARQVLSTSKISISRWHARLGHPSSAIVRFVLSKNYLPFVNDSSPEIVGDACQQAKSHQLPYSSSFSRSKAPLELVFSNVWGPACESIGRNKYYVSFIDDFSKFTWIYLLKHKSEVF
jgi:histone deacetylase 1/2